MSTSSNEKRSSQRPNMREVSALLASHIEPLVMEILPAGRRDGPEWRAGSVAGEPGKSLAIKLLGPKAGIWADFAGGPAGDALSLVAHVLFRGDLRAALSWALNWLALDNRQTSVHTSRPATQVRESVDRESQNLERARSLWRESKSAKGTIVERYLRARNLDLPDHCDQCIRFHPACPHGPGVRLPVMMALMTDPVTNSPTGVHRTPLLADGTGRDHTADKKMFGKAGVIRLVPDEEVTIGLGIAEGIETALSVIQCGGWSPVWAVCSAGGMERFPLLSGVETLTIFADHDIAGLNAARDCSRSWLLGGRDVKILAPRSCGDWNDAAREGTA